LLFKDYSVARFQPLAVFNYIAARNASLPPTRVDLTRQQADGCRFTRPSRPKQSENFSALYSKTYTSNRLYILKTVPQIVSLNGWGYFIQK
jgi:hypothetical protein